MFYAWILGGLIGRLQLIESVLSSFYGYWCTDFHLPMHLIKAVESICCSFLWKGTASKISGARVSWAQICRPKSKDGLRLMRVAYWNKAYLARIIWLFFQGSYSLWIARIKVVLLKDKCFWNLVLGSNCFWCWRRLLKIREQIRPQITYKVGNGELIHIWLDDWHPRSLLLGSYGSQLIYSSDRPLFARLSSVITNAQWAWPPISSHEVAEIIRSVASISPRVFADIVGCPQRAPLLQLGLLGMLLEFQFLRLLGQTPTKLRISKYVIDIDTSCGFCVAPKSRDHLFFVCPFSS